MYSFYKQYKLGDVCYNSKDKKRTFLCVEAIFPYSKSSNCLAKKKLFRKIFRNVFIILGTFILLVWRSSGREFANNGDVVTVNKATWNYIISHTKLRNGHGDVPLIDDFNQKLKLKNMSLKVPEFKIQKIKDSPPDRREWLLQLLKYPLNLKMDPSSPRDSSYSIMKNGVRDPLKEDEPVILVWWAPDYLIRNKNKHFLEREFQGVCGKCRLTTDRAHIARAKVVLFDNIPTESNLRDLPSQYKRQTDQAYVLWHRETPAKTYHLLNNMEGSFDHMFNYTMSYRRDADIHWYLGNADFTKRSMPQVHHKNPQQFVEKIVDSKRHLAVWVVSNCDSTKGAVARMKYALELEEAGLKLDKFGKCFNRFAPKKDFSAFLLPYKFYLAFENSWHCKDYLTEKFWRNGLMSNLVPVIWGPSRQDVADVAPTHSYIHIEDFENPKDLVQYLNYLDQNDTAYKEYFNWRLLPVSFDVPANMIRTGYEPAICKICRVLNENNGVLPHKILPSATDWVFVDGENSKCLLYDLK